MKIFYTEGISGVTNVQNTRGLEFCVLYVCVCVCGLIKLS
jgi:hypothetical protein